MQGSLGNDVLCGRGGSDRMYGGGGSDRLFGGDGNDTIRSADGVFDVIGCGSGRDEVTADKGDLVGVDCESVKRA